MRKLFPAIRVGALTKFTFVNSLKYPGDFKSSNSAEETITIRTMKCKQTGPHNFT